MGAEYRRVCCGVEHARHDAAGDHHSREEPSDDRGGTAYADLGATATDDSGSTILRTYQDGREVSAVSLDTSLAGAHVIAYVAHDLSGNVATSSRQVIGEAATSSAPLGGSVASSTPANDNLSPEAVASSSATSSAVGE